MPKPSLATAPILEGIDCDNFKVEYNQAQTKMRLTIKATGDQRHLDLIEKPSNVSQCHLESAMDFGMARGLLDTYLNTRAKLRRDVATVTDGWAPLYSDLTDNQKSAIMTPHEKKRKRTTNKTLPPSEPIPTPNSTQKRPKMRPVSPPEVPVSVAEAPSTTPPVASPITTCAAKAEMFDQVEVPSGEASQSIPVRKSDRPRKQARR
ncbi:unnamed protein product [Rhizoctonia solani]|uniref:Uncharacterized protein n=1 Tax=Rhizoctonia solani TaxID=456999 RepID=A0A8H3HXK3_9AGAM|nr:unnamed protein product [Rhizoctonia solani]